MGASSLRTPSSEGPEARMLSSPKASLARLVLGAGRVAQVTAIGSMLHGAQPACWTASLAWPHAVRPRDACGTRWRGHALKKCPRDKMPFPARLGDTVYHLVPSEGDGAPEIAGDIAHTVGVDDGGRLFVYRDGTPVMFGAKGRCFLSEEDARYFAADPASLPMDHANVQCGMLDLPLYPGDELYFPDYFPDYDPLFDRWQILESICVQMILNEDGSVDVVDHRRRGQDHRERPLTFCPPCSTRPARRAPT